jgi:glycosyltransferase involved in cell wall biosynthesis
VALAATVGIQGDCPLKGIKVLALPKYGHFGASSRLRLTQYLPWLQQERLQVTVFPLLPDELLLARYQKGSYRLWPLLRAYSSRWRALLRRRNFDVLWIEKEALPWLPLWLELALLRGIPYVLDYDDAIFHNYDQHRSAWVRYLFGGRLNRLMAGATLVVGGNSYLAQHARAAGAPWVELVPTVIDLDRYEIAPKNEAKIDPVDDFPRIVWIGSPATVHYLQILHEPLRILAARHDYVLRIIGGGAVELPGVRVELLPWSEATEVENISTCDVGVMPLLDSPWESGKCGYKLIQYMACNLPVVASNVGANTEIVQEGENGFLASTPQEWVEALSGLLNNQPLRSRMGRAGRLSVERSYCVQQSGPRMASLLRTSARGS